MTHTNDPALDRTVSNFATVVASLGALAFAMAAHWAGASSAQLAMAGCLPPLVIGALWRLGRKRHR